jgi:hypothetical protein
MGEVVGYLFEDLKSFRKFQLMNRSGVLDFLEPTKDSISPVKVLKIWQGNNGICVVWRWVFFGSAAAVGELVRSLASSIVALAADDGVV